MKVKVITGYVPIPNHPRTPEEYGRLGDQLFRGITEFPVKSFYNQVQETWLYRFIDAQTFNVKHFEGDNPEKNTLAYHCVQHQKPEWLLAAALTDPYQADTYVWIDYGIAHVPGVTTQVVTDFLKRLEKDDFAIPGCWDQTTDPIEMSYPWWRFCGGVMVVPRQHVMAFDTEFKNRVKAEIKRTRHLSWEVNSLARLERLKRLPIRWYKADHNETLFTNYSPPTGLATPRV